MRSDRPAPAGPGHPFRRLPASRFEHRPRTDERGRPQDTGPYPGAALRARQRWVAVLVAVALGAGWFLVRGALTEPATVLRVVLAGLVALACVGLVGWVLTGQPRYRRAIAYDRRRAEWVATQPEHSVPPEESLSPYAVGLGGAHSRPSVDAYGRIMESESRTLSYAWPVGTMIFFTLAAVLAVLATVHRGGEVVDAWPWLAAWVVLVPVLGTQEVLAFKHARQWERERAAWLMAQERATDPRWA